MPRTPPRGTWRCACLSKPAPPARGRQRSPRAQRFCSRSFALREEIPHLTELLVAIVDELPRALRGELPERGVDGLFDKFGCLVGIGVSPLRWFRDDAVDQSERFEVRRRH